MGPAEKVLFRIEDGSSARFRNFVVHLKFRHLRGPPKKDVPFSHIKSFFFLNVTICGAPHSAFVPNVCHFLTWLCQHSDVYVGTGMT